MVTLSESDEGILKARLMDEIDKMHERLMESFDRIGVQYNLSELDIMRTLNKAGYSDVADQYKEWVEA